MPGANHFPAKLIYLRLCLATVIHNLKWVKITHTCLIRDHHLQLLMFTVIAGLYRAMFFQLIAVRTVYSRCAICMTEAQLYHGYAVCVDTLL